MTIAQAIKLMKRCANEGPSCDEDCDVCPYSRVTTKKCYDAMMADIAELLESLDFSDGAPIRPDVMREVLDEYSTASSVLKKCGLNKDGIDYFQVAGNILKDVVTKYSGGEQDG